MKFTEYFQQMRQRHDRVGIKMEWIAETISSPEFAAVQADGRIRKWKKIIEADRFLRVILLSDGETVHNAFFDRGFKGSNP